jgi:type I restriction enzyme S subunit
MARTYIGDFCDYYKGINIPRSETDVEFDIPYLHYGDIYKLYDFKINLNTKYDKIIKIKKDVKIKPEQYLSDGDIVYTLTSETVDDLGHSTLIINKQNLDFVSGMETTIIRIRDKTNFVPEFINYLFQSDNFRQRLRQYVTGMKVFRVHPRDLMRILIDIPDTQTQQKIVSILDSLTNKIDTNRKINDYLVA